MSTSRLVDRVRLLLADERAARSTLYPPVRLDASPVDPPLNQARAPKVSEPRRDAREELVCDGVDSTA